jgi:flagellar biosynthetic protein FliS
MVNREEYVSRIGQASPAQLVVINFELIVDALMDAINACQTKQDQDIYCEHISRAQNGLSQLINGLNMEVPMSLSFYELYRYANQVLSKAYYKPNVEEPKEVLELMNTVLAGWRQITPTEDEGSLTQQQDSRPQRFAGLTYNRSGQLEEYVTDTESRGFKA